MAVTTGKVAERMKRIDERQRRRKLGEQLFDAIERDDVWEVRKLISQGADVNLQNSHEETPLIVAAQFSSEIVEILVGAGADVQGSDVKGTTALHYALTKEDRDLARILVMHGANIFAVNLDGDSTFDCSERPISMQNYLESCVEERNSLSKSDVSSETLGR